MTEKTDAAEVAELADGFLASRLSWGTHADRWNDADWQRRFWTEVAQTLLASGWYADTLAAREAAARAEALREAADAWTQGAWSDVMLPKPTPPAVPVIAYSNRMGDWLRDRADSIARTDGAGS